LAFYASTFIFDGVPSETYNLTISSPSGDLTESEGASNVEIFTEHVYRRPQVYLLGVQETPTLKFPIIIDAPQELSAQDTSLIEKWLFGQRTFKDLCVLQPDMQGVVYRALLTEPKIRRTGNIIHGFSAMVVCDAPYGWTYPKTTTYTASTNPVDASITINNLSDANDYLYPTVTFQMVAGGGGLTLTNTSDDSRTWAFTGLSANEIITADNDRKIITSSLNLNRFATNYRWFRLIPGVNVIGIAGNVTYVRWTYRFARKIGG
jgi:phage-related protein